MWRNLWYDEKEKTIRGSFINLTITVVFATLIVVGAFVPWIASNLKEEETVLIGFYVVSFGLWTGKKSVEYIKKMGLENVLNKHGLNADDLSEAGETLRTKRMNGTVVKAGPDDAEQRAREREAAK